MKTENLPPFFSTGDRGSFALDTIKHRKPAIIDQIIRSKCFLKRERDSLHSLKDEMENGTIVDPFVESSFKTEGVEKRAVQMWRKDLTLYTGKIWFDIPFYFAEAYLYLRILIAVGYYDPGSRNYLEDPFSHFKERELLAGGGGLEMGRLIVKSFDISHDSSEVFAKLIYNSLWGNRIDLSLFKIAERSRGRLLSVQENSLIIDHSQKLVELLQKARTVDIILDNVGQELVCDLITVWYLLTTSHEGAVNLHAKKHPIYVSDSMIKDIENTIEVLVSDKNQILSKIGQDLRVFIETDRIVLYDHFFWSGSLHYPDLPAEIVDILERSDLVLFKGDVNYRRLLSDRRWEPGDRMKDIVDYFPVTFATLRTMKSEAVVDISQDLLKTLNERDPEWRVNGERGIIQVVEKADG